MTFADAIARERRRQRGALLLATSSGAAGVCASCALLGLSGWFITGAALAGGSGTVAAFNYLLPSAAIRLFAIVRTAGRYGERLEGHRAALNALAALRPAIFAGLARRPPERALALSTGEGLARMVEDVEAIEMLFIRAPTRWVALVGGAFGIGLVSLASGLAAAALAVLLIMQVAASVGLAELNSRRLGAALQREMGRFKDVLASTLAARSELAAYGLTDWATRNIEAEVEPLERTRRALLQADGWQVALGALAMGAATITVLFLARQAPLPLMALAGLAAGATSEAAASLARSSQQHGAAREAICRIDGAMGAGDSSVDDERDEEGASNPWRSREVVLMAGERLAIIGPSGCGKTTMLEGLLGLRQSETGPIQLEDGMKEGVCRASFAYAPQEAVLLAGTVRENLQLADPRAAEAQLWDALHDADLDERVRQLPDGLDSWIGDAGERLSGGERRRLCLARALLRPAPWLALDEPTEGLDADTEARVVERLAARVTRTGQGLLLVSHRLAPRRLCSRTLDWAEADLSNAAA